MDIGDPHRRIYDPNYWRDRAEEMRTAAEGMKNEDCRNKMLQIAADYETIALRTIQRLVKIQSSN